VTEDESLYDDDDSAEKQPTESGLYDVDSEKVDSGPSEKTPKAKRSGPRTSASQLIALAWGGVGMALERSGTDPGVGRVLQFEAPLAGERIDQLIKDTWLDTLVQPFIKEADKLEGLGALIMFPVLIGAYERKPEIGGAIEGILRDVVSEVLIEMAPVIKKKDAKAKRAAQSMKGLNEALGLGPDDDPVSAVLMSILQVPQEPPNTETEP